MPRFGNSFQAILTIPSPGDWVSRLIERESSLGRQCEIKEHLRIVDAKQFAAQLHFQVAIDQ